MDRRQIAVKLTMDGLGLPVKVDSFEDRLIFQKAIYLAQAANVHMGYFFRWYLYGPYCPALTQDEYAIRRDIIQEMDDSDTWMLDSQSQTKLENLKTLIIDEDRHNMARHLELLASVHFLIVQKQVPDRDVTKITETLQRYEKHFSPQEVQQAIYELDEYGLFQN